MDLVFQRILPNENPNALTDTTTVDNDATVNIDVILNDSDPDGNSLTISSATADVGTVVIESDQTLTYTPQASYVGIATVTYIISDGLGGTATSTVSITVNDSSVAPGTPVLLYEQAFTSFPTGEWTGPATFSATRTVAGQVVDHTIFSYYSNPANPVKEYPFFQTVGVLEVGKDLSGNRDFYRDESISEGDQLEFYAPIRLGNYGGTPYIYFSYTFYDADDVALSGATTAGVSNGPFQQNTPPAPANTSYVRFRFRVTGASTTYMIIGGVRITNLNGETRPIVSGVGPFITARNLEINIPKTYDLTGVFTNVTSLYSNSPDISIDGMLVTITPTAYTDIKLAEERYIFGVKGILQSYAPYPLRFVCSVNDPLVVNSAQIWEPTIEIGQGLTFDPISVVTGGVWPYTAVLNPGAPTWARELNSYQSTGTTEFVPTTPVTDQAVSWTITDSSTPPQTVTVSLTINAINKRDRTPDITIQGGTPESPVDIRSALPTTIPNRYYVVALGNGDFTSGNLFNGMARTDDNAFVLRGATGASPNIQTININGCGVIVEDIHVQPISNYQGNFSDLTAKQRGSVLVQSPSSRVGSVFLENVETEGWKTTLENEPDVNWVYRVRNDSGYEGEVIYSGVPLSDARTEWVNADQCDSAWVQTNYPDVYEAYGHTVYNGGFSLTSHCSLLNCQAHDCNMGLQGGGTHVRISNTTIEDVRVDGIRIFNGGNGLHLHYVTFSGHRYCNRPDEHSDAIQGLASGTSSPFGPSQPLPDRVVVERCVIYPRRGESSMFQGNTGGDGSESKELQNPRMGAENWLFIDSFMCGNIGNLVNPTFYQIIIRNCWITSTYEYGPEMDYGNIRSIGAGDIQIYDSVISNLLQENSLTIIDSNNVRSSTLTITNELPDISNLSLPVRDRVRISPSGTVGSGTIGPRHLVST